MTRISDRFPFCIICDELLMDPVTFPCGHELCLECFQHNMQSANFTCSLCRKRVSTWARKNSVDPVNKSRKAELEELYEQFGSIESLKLAVRLQKEEDVKQTPKVICNEGDLMKEYEDEVKAVQDQKLMEEELSMKEVQKYREEAMKLERQIMEDEKLAKSLHEKEPIPQQTTDCNTEPARKEQSKVPGKKRHQRMSSIHAADCSSPKITKWFTPRSN